MANPLSHAELLSLLRYEPDTGKFYWLVTRGKGLRGSEAGTISTHKFTAGYRFIRISGQQYRAHRLAWFFVHGEWPQKEIDHINRDCDDNRICNLREATRAENLWNTRGKSPAGLKGVKKRRAGYGRLRTDRYVARIQGDHIGSFDTPEAAHAAYVAEAKVRFGEFARAS